MRELAHALRDRVRAAYTTLRRARGALRADAGARSVARRLRNVCLRYLGALDDAAARALAVAQFDAADNMTDTSRALAALNDSVAPERDALFARFEARWRDEPLVLDKWFALQAPRSGRHARAGAGAARAPALQRAQSQPRALAGGRVRAAQLRALPRAPTAAATRSSPTRCWRSIPTNPQLAATVAGAFNLWKRFAAAAARAACRRRCSASRTRPACRRTSPRS